MFKDLVSRTLMTMLCRQWKKSKCPPTKKKIRVWDQHASSEVIQTPKLACSVPKGGIQEQQRTEGQPTASLAGIPHWEQPSQMSPHSPVQNTSGSDGGYAAPGGSNEQHILETGQCPGWPVTPRKKEKCSFPVGQAPGCPTQKCFLLAPLRSLKTEPSPKQAA